MSEKLRVGVIFGGRSGEHEVSLASARSVIQALDPERYEVVPIGIDKGGRWLPAPESVKMIEDRGVEEKLSIAGDLVAVNPLAATGGHINPFDVIVPMLHGPYGEDGTVQGFLELARIPYVGAGVAASAVGMDKVLMKAVFARHDFPIVPYAALKRRRWETEREAVLDEVSARFTFPVFVKPANLGSSVGISRADDRDTLTQAIELACAYDRKVVVEQGIDAREVECSVLGNDEPEASLPGEIVPHGSFYDYHCKYTEGESDLILPAPISPELVSQVQDIARRAFQAVDCAGMARVDFFLERGTDRLFLNELNTIPGFTDLSMYSMMWEASGLSYPRLLDRLIELALERFADKERNRVD